MGHKAFLVSDMVELHDIVWVLNFAVKTGTGLKFFEKLRHLFAFPTISFSVVAFVFVVMILGTWLHDLLEAVLTRTSKPSTGT